MNSVDFNSINNELSEEILEKDCLEELFNELGWEYRRERNGYRGKCFQPGSDGENLKVCTDGNTLRIYWTCFSHQCHHKYKASLLGLVRGFLSAGRDKPCTINEAIEFIKRFTGENQKGRSTKLRPESDLTPAQFRPFPRAKAIRQLDIPAIYFTAVRDFSADVLCKFDVGYSTRKRRVIVPLYDDEGLTCVGYQGRSSHPPCKKCPRHHSSQTECRYGQARWMRESNLPPGYLYGYHLAAQTKPNAVYVVEGAPDVWRAYEAGKCALALLGCHMSEAQFGKLATLRRTIVLALDNDPPGRNATLRISEMIKAHGIPHWIAQIPATYKDLGEMPVDEVRKLKVVRGYVEDDADQGQDHYLDIPRYFFDESVT